MLSALGRADLVLARLAEGHLDAVAILGELVGPDAAGGAWGVWAANPPGAALHAQTSGAGWRLTGDKPWCSGAAACTHALVTAQADDGYRLFAVELDPATARPVDGSWPAVGMAGSDSRTVRFAGAPAVAVGGPDAYLRRPGFWWGAVGVAAVWHGGASGVADALLAAHARRTLGDHARAHLGAVDAALAASRAVLDGAGTAVDADPDATGPAAEALARRARAVAERSATEVLDRVGRALGATPLSLDARHGRRVADLTVYLRQSHAERDLVALADAALASEVSW
jgi:alkylation response protein AidB-like acyl-CoA dehydrogenase